MIRNSMTCWVGLFALVSIGQQAGAADCPGKPICLGDLGPPQLVERQNDSVSIDYASDSTPQISPIGDSSSNAQAPTSSEAAPANAAPHRYVIFAQPASFPVPRFSSSGERSSRMAVIISEGMAFKFEENGRYTVRMVVETPPTNVDLRMQFQLVRPGINVTSVGGHLNGFSAEELFAEHATWSIAGVSSEPPAYVQVGTISLPVLKFRPTLEQKKSTDALYWQVEQKGYSPLLNTTITCFKKQPGQAQPYDLRVIRTGVMDIGSAPETTEF